MKLSPASAAPARKQATAPRSIWMNTRYGEMPREVALKPMPYERFVKWGGGK
jgi:hypothetical protein